MSGPTSEDSQTLATKGNYGLIIPH
jgi:hypothetical protein